MENILQPLKQYVLHIRSKDVDREGDLNSHLFIDLAEKIDLNPFNTRVASTSVIGRNSLQFL